MEKLEVNLKLFDPIGCRIENRRLIFSKIESNEITSSNFLKDSIHDLACPKCGVKVEFDEQDEHGIGTHETPNNHECHECEEVFNINHVSGWVASLKEIK